ncbi:Aste57867_25051 [Aphanomyces stellatus]|uniref:Aste57867_25051 protein n=1 Tax=Aphanomyces stellatus TaxID=120398 RepID=A0A485LTG3_9STRA|nr:hypothetical protein As57867_024973 [Aphanomyces stellatus]VFU01682.1 Aste57867_25051 [Aphanomyces stellatus]
MIRRGVPSVVRKAVAGWQRRPYYIWRDIPYADLNNPKQILDVVVPKNPPFPREALPVAVFVHGGAWQRGDKEGAHYVHVAPTLARHAGIVVVTINYRLSPEVQYPEHVEDTLRAVQWVAQEIHKINGLVGISGVYNILRLSHATIFGSMVLDPVFGSTVQRWREASVMQPDCPARHTDTSILLLHAEDDFHLDEDATELQAWLEAHEYTRVRRQVIPACNHLSIVGNVRDESVLSPTTQAIVDWIHETTSETRGAC